MHFALASVLLLVPILIPSERIRLLSGNESNDIQLHMSKHKLEYIWLDGYKPTQSLRGKTMIVEDFSGKLEDAKQWSFDGSSTEQASGDDSDCLLQPVHVITDPDRFGGDGWLVMCEVLNADGTPHESNGRATIDEDDDDFWFGFEQEYTLIDLETNLPLAFPRMDTPRSPRALTTLRLEPVTQKGRSSSRRTLASLPRSRFERRGHQRRGHDGPVGVPNLRQG